MNTELENNDNNFKKDFLKLMNHSIFRNTVENVREYKDIKLVTIETRRWYLVSD